MVRLGLDDVQFAVGIGHIDHGAIGGEIVECYLAPITGHPIAERTFHTRQQARFRVPMGLETGGFLAHLVHLGSLPRL